MLEGVPTFPADSPRPQHIAAAFRARLRAPRFDTLITEGPLKRRTEETGLLHLCIQVIDRVLLVMRNRRPALLTDVSFVRVVPPTLRTLNGKLVIRLLMATTTPRAACSTVGHSCLIP